LSEEYPMAKKDSEKWHVHVKRDEEVLH